MHTKYPKLQRYFVLLDLSNQWLQVSPYVQLGWFILRQVTKASRVYRQTDVTCVLFSIINSDLIVSIACQYAGKALLEVPGLNF